MKIVVNDTSVLLNLLATGHLEGIATTLEWKIAITEAVQQEAKKLRNMATGQMEEVGLDSFVSPGVIQILNLESEDEPTRFIRLAAVVDEGEAMSIAVATARSIPLAIDDRKATNYVGIHFPELELWTTPQIVKLWADTSSVSSLTLSAALIAVEKRARYVPQPTHPLKSWWEKSKAAGMG